MGTPTKSRPSRDAKAIDFLLLGGGLAAATAAQDLSAPIRLAWPISSRRG
ncbi:MAG: hypothetical protein WAO93_09450 [Orrella sp.]|jgi:hypothetical protein